jgi:5-methylcytosine-specific restriction endonuclease McrA
VFFFRFWCGVTATSARKITHALGKRKNKTKLFYAGHLTARLTRGCRAAQSAQRQAGLQVVCQGLVGEKDRPQFGFRQVFFAGAVISRQRTATGHALSNDFACICKRKEYARPMNCCKCRRKTTKETHRRGSRVCRDCRVAASQETRHRQRFKGRERKRMHEKIRFPFVAWGKKLSACKGRCPLCRKRKRLTIDHIRGFKDGGKLTISNLQPLCQRCNLRKGGIETRLRRLRKRAAALGI